MSQNERIVEETESNDFIVRRPSEILDSQKNDVWTSVLALLSFVPVFPKFFDEFLKIFEEKT